jgi:hypothetical protein
MRRSGCTGICGGIEEMFVANERSRLAKCDTDTHVCSAFLTFPNRHECLYHFSCLSIVFFPDILGEAAYDAPA